MMGIESKEEVIAWFKELSGAQRIEVLSGLLNTCIPLEWRFFATLIESLGRRDYQTLLEDEHKANTPQELEVVCSSDWLPLGASHVDNHIASNHNVESRVAGDRISPQPPSVEVTPAGVLSTHLKPPGESVVRPSRDLMTKNSSYESLSPIPPKSDMVLTNVRKRVVVYLCLLSSSNRVCATIVFDAFRKYLNVEKIKTHLEKRGLHPLKERRDKSPSGNNSFDPRPPDTQPRLDPQLVAEVTLLHTLAIYHPAFTFEQQSILSRQLKNIQELFNCLAPSYMGQRPAPVYYFQPQFLPYPSIPAVNGPFAHFPTVGETIGERKLGHIIPISCYNCGESGHLGNECIQETVEDATRATNFHLNLGYVPPVASISSTQVPPVVSSSLPLLDTDAVHSTNGPLVVRVDQNSTKGCDVPRSVLNESMQPVVTRAAASDPPSNSHTVHKQMKPLYQPPHNRHPNNHGGGEERSGRPLVRTGVHDTSSSSSSTSSYSNRNSNHMNHT